MLDGVLYGFLKFLLDLVETTDVVPSSSGNLDHGLAKSRRIGRSKCKAEVIHCNTK
jgi:hypothetical protein